MTEEARRKAIAARGQCKTSITKLERYMQTESITLEDLEVRKQTLKDVFARYQDINLQLTGADADADDVEERVLTLLALIERRIKTFTNRSSAYATSTNLPTLDIAIFDGKDVAAYKPFIEMFEAVVHNDPRIPTVTKLCFLKKYVKGEPLQLIDSLPVIGDSYLAALELLKQRYDNPALIISSHINMLLDMPKLMRGTAPQLRELVAKVKQQITALKNHSQPVDKWDAILACIILRKVDPFTARLYHAERDNTKVLNVSELLDFLAKRAIVLEASPTSSDTAGKGKSVTNLASAKATSVGQECQLCSETHRLFKCPKFGLMTLNGRIEYVAKNRLCKICLGAHTKKCRFHFKCTNCNSSTHNTLLHEEQPKGNGPSEQEKSKPPDANPQVNLHTYNNNVTNVVLPTAKVIVSDIHNNKYVVRALLDCGSQTSFCTTALANKLGLKQYNLNKSITTLGTGCSKTTKAINITIHSRVQDFKLDITCALMDKITSTLPQTKLNKSALKFPNFVTLADDEFHTPGEVDILLASDICFRIIQDGKIEGGPEDPVLLSTRLGYVVSGSMTVSSSNHSHEVSMFVASNTDLDNQVKQFWEAEKVPEYFVETIPEHEYSEKVFQESVSLQNNCFQVKLPLKVNIEDIEPAGSYIIAHQRLNNLEKRFVKDPYFHKLYREFIEEYIELGHAKVLDMDHCSAEEQPLYFLPHHAVLRPDKTTNKLRVVFDASAATKGGHSLNDIQCNGPVVQRSLFDILLLFRTCKFTIQCDIRHMYRMIRLHPEHRPLQNILWRNDGALQCLQLQTITYGFKSSAFLATRCLVELAKRYKSEFPLACDAIVNNSYVDDIQGGSDTLQGALLLKKELISLMELGGFTLHKWVSNEPQILNDIPEKSLGVDARDIDNNKTVQKILGLSYSARDDIFRMNGRAVTAPKVPTKRNVLSSISRLFDPVGFAGPITVKAKLILQQIWQYNLEWDNPLPPELVKIWEDFYTNLTGMPDIKIPRYMQLSEADEVELIGYCDASTDAYGCCIYLRVHIQGKYNVFLLCSKSRVAPLGSKLTIPKLELNGALLLAKLASHVSAVLKITTTKLFCDSKIVLGWLNSSPMKVPAYIGNRIKEITKLTPSMSWLFTPGLMNPADILSRGADPSVLADCKLWQQGPDYLTESKDLNMYVSEIERPIQVEQGEKVVEQGACYNTSIKVDKVIDPMFTKFSSLFYMTKVVARIYRFIHVCRGQAIKTGPLTVPECHEALLCIIRGIQIHYFEEELNDIAKKVNLTSNLKALNPFIDGKGLLRVGGRLDNAANLDYDKKHPIILPKHCHITKLIIRQEHLMLMHGGLKLVLSSLCQKYCIINAVREVKSVIHKCITCCRQKATTAQQLMGSLPSERVTPARVFQNVGLDYCGPFEIKQSSIRRSIITKGYVAVFVCFASKAVDMEVVSDMSTEIFLAAFKRFIARRGCPSNVYCDNGTTFKGANNKLKEFYQPHGQDSFQSEINNYALQKNIQFHFIPKYSPNHGGLWEAAVKSAKYHLKRVASVKAFTYEQFNTIIVEIEGILNSRPLTPLTNDPSDFSYLTPGHFIIGAPITSLPQPDLIEIPANRLRFWRCCEQVRQHFWKAWSKQYLSLLNARTKWQKSEPNLKLGMLVLLQSNNQAPLVWPMGRIIKVFQGKDGKVRVVEVQTPDKKIHSRAVSKIVVLPIE